MIGALAANQDEDERKCTEAEGMEPKENEKAARKTAKPAKVLQGIQVFENGEFITKYLEVDPDIPNDKLNGTIEYSNDYRRAQSPKRLAAFCGYSSDTTENHSGSEISERSNNGSSTDTFDQSQLISEIETGRTTLHYRVLLM